MNRIIIASIALALLLSCSQVKNVASSRSLLPLPANIEESKGRFIFNNATTLKIAAEEKDANAVGNFLAASPLALERGEKDSNAVVMTICNDVEGITSPEGYAIETTEENITVKAISGAGLFYAAQTILQLAAEGNGVPAGKITDEPKFAYRGMMLDVSRHFFDKSL